MRKKRRPQHKRKSSHHPRDKQNSRKQPRENLLDQQLLTLFYHSSKPLRDKDILDKLGLTHSSQKTLFQLLTDLTKKKVLKQTGKHSYQAGPKHGLFEGVVDQNARGFGFVTNLTSKISPPGYTKDPFLSPSNMRSARHGDKVLIRVFRVKKDGRPEAEVLSILERGRDHLAGFISRENGKYIVTPEDTRYPFTVFLSSKPEEKIPDGYAVIVKLNDETDSASRQRGELVEVLGDPTSVDVQMRMVIEKFNLPHTFSKETITQVENISDTITPTKNRLDLRKIRHVTIDGETAKDFDDAVAVTKTRSGYRLYVSIADVSSYVPPGSPLDKDAYQRGTSIYFPGRVIPMLPEKLSNNLCSLVPDQDRYAFSAILDFDRQGHLRKKKFSKSIICSKKRFTYTTVKQILIDKDPDVRRAHKAFLTPLKYAEELARALMVVREERGSIGFSIPEPFISLDDEGRIKSIQRTERNFAHQLIEEFMLAANEAVAETFTENKLDGLYRIHERPSPEKVKEFIDFARSLGLTLPPYRQDPDWFGEVLKVVKGTPKEYVINNLLLRAMQQARYDTKNVGHFGLAATDYTHFTSPIRRYPDLTVHRTLQTFLTRNAPVRVKKKDKGGLSLTEMGKALSTKERDAVRAEREMNDRLKIQFMKGKIGEEFDAVISGVNSSAIFVELLELFISGGISLSALRDDHYIYDEKRHRITGKSGGRSFQIGNLIRVKLVDVNSRSNRISFAPV